MIFLFLAHGFEETEALCTFDLLRRAELPVQLVSITEDLHVESAHGLTVRAHTTFAAVPAEALRSAEALILPGGMPGAENLKNFPPLLKALQEAAPATLRCAICAAPMVLAEAGLLESRKATCYPGFERFFPASAQYDAEHYVAEDGNLITAAGPAATVEFGLTIVDRLCGEEVVNRICDGMLYN